MTNLRFTLLGASHICDETGHTLQFRSRKAKALLIYLATMADQSHNRDHLMTLLYPGSLEKSAASNLRQLRYQIRQAVPNVPGAGGKMVDILAQEGAFLRMNRAYPVALDVDDFGRTLATARRLRAGDWRTNGAYQHQLEVAIATYGGPFLTDFFLDDSDPFESWAQARRDRLRHDVLDSLSHLTAIAIHQREYDQARDYAERQLAADNLRESAHRQLMEILARSGQVGAALAQYEKCARALRAEMSIAPSAKTTALFEQIRTGNLDGAQASQVRIRGYSLSEKVAAGSFGDVYLAAQPHLGRKVAVKVIRPEYANRPEFIRRFEAEARLVARLEHPYIVPLYDYWREPDGAYLVMRWFGRGTLADAMAGQPWPIPRILRLTDQLTAALDVAHRHGVIHRDLKPANILLDDDENAYLTDFGIAKDIFDDAELTGTAAMIGTPAYISPEQILSERVSPKTDIYAFGVILFELLTGQKPFPGASVPELIYKHLNDRLPSVSGLQPHLPFAIDNVIWQTTAKQADDRFLTGMALRQALHAALGSEHDVAAATQMDFDPRLQDLNPYRGLRAFQEGDRDVFFGRSALTDHLLEQLRQPDLLDHSAADRFLAVVGPSGSGKSSVVRAGLIPALRDGALSGSEKWFISDMVPGSHPFEELETALRRIAAEAPASLLEPLQKDERGLVRVLRHILPDDGEGQRGQLLLVIDQFEELFTLVANDERRMAFLDSLMTALADRRGQLRLIITIRADFFDRPLQFTRLGELLRQRTEVVLPLNQAELEEVIRVPAARSGALVENGLIAAIIADVNGQPGALPLLQYTLTELYEKRQGKLMTMVAYRDLGGVLGAIGRRAEALFNALSAPGQAAARQLFLRLVTLGEGVEDTRRRVLLTEIEEIDGADAGAVINDLLATFGRHRLLTFDRDPVSRGPTVEVAHEALLREWPRLRAWLDENRQDIRVQRRLAITTRDWQASGEDTSFLLRGTRLQNMAVWAAETSLALTPVERRFVDASRAEKERHAAAEAAQQVRERALEKRSRTVLRALVIVFGAAALLAIGLTAFAFSERDKAQQVSLAAQAQTVLDRGEDMALPALLAIQSLGYGYSSAADTALLGALARGFTLNFVGHRDSLSSIVFSADGRYVLTGSNDATARLWEAQSGRELRQFIGHNGLVTHVAFAPDGKTVFTSSVDHTVRLWDAETGQFLRQLPIKDSPVRALAVSPDGTLLVTGDERGIIRLWDARTLVEIRSLEGHSDVVLSTVFSPGGRYVASGSIDTTARLWDVQTGREIRRFGHAAGVNSVEISPNGHMLVTASSDHLARIWDIASGQPSQLLIGHSDLVVDAGFSPDNRWIVTSSNDTTVRLWDVASGQEVEQFVRQSGRAIASSFSPNGRNILSVGSDTVGRLWNVEVESEPRTYAVPFSTIHSTAVSAVVFSIDERQILVGRRDGVVQTWDVATGRIVQERAFATGGLLTGLAFSPNNLYIFTSSGEGIAQLWDMQTGLALQTFQGHAGAIWAVAFAPDGATILTGGADGTARLWNASNGAEIRRFIGHTGSVQAVAFAPDGQSILTGSEDGTAWLWEMSTGLGIRQFIGHAGPVQSVAFAPDGRLILTGSDDATARLWRSETGATERTFIGHTDAIRTVGFMPDPNSVFTGSTDSTARLWDAGTGAVVRQFAGHAGPIRAWAFSADGGLILTAENRFAYLWQADMADVIATACAQLLRDFTAEERSLYRISGGGSTCDVPRAVDGLVPPTWTPFPTSPAPVWTPISEER